MGKLEGKVAIVTGGGRGIGLGISLAFAREGADVILAGRTLERLEAAAEEITGLGRRALPVVCDVGDEAQVIRMVADGVEAFGPIDVLVNNAQSWGPPDEQLRSPPLLSLEDISEESWDNTFRTGVKAAFFCSKAVFPHMKERGGKIINIGSHAGIRGAPLLADYAANKEAVRGLTRSAARAWGQYGINVNTIAPTVLTEASTTTAETDPVAFAAHLAQRALPRLGTPEDAGALAVFLAGEASDYLTGQTFLLDGGFLML